MLSSAKAWTASSLVGTKLRRRIFGYSVQEAIGQQIAIIIPPGRLDEENDVLARLRRGERVDNFETVRKRKDGGLLEVSVTMSPVKDAWGRIIGTSRVARDITERKRMESVSKEAELSGRLLQLQDERRVARELHDGVGQLLAALSINFHTIANEKQSLSPLAARCMKETPGLIDQSISELRTISFLLHPPLLDELGLGSAVKRYVKGFGERSNIFVSLDLSPDLGRLPRDVELSLFRIVQECLTNIHRHSHSATASVRLSHLPGEIQLEISDQGRGISPEIQEKVVAGRSTGVGLRGMLERVRQIGGALHIQSNKNGTSVLVAVPIRCRAEHKSDCMVPARANTIVIADDFAAFRSLVRIMLRENGFQNVAEALDGVEAVAKAAELQPDLVLLDISMPNLGGIKAAAQIRSVVPESKILFVSQNNDPDIVRAALSDGAGEYVCKTEISRELLPAIEAVLGGKRFVGAVPHT
jgi:PAS domain S-box-containing protein